MDVPLSYRVTKDKRSGIHSDLNRPDDEQYIAGFVGRVVQVSIQSVKTVESLPADFGGPFRHRPRGPADT